MSTNAVVPTTGTDPEATLVTTRKTIVTAVRQMCAGLAEQYSLAKFEIAVKSRVERGINNDNELRQVDELLANVCMAADAVEAATKPVIGQAHSIHKDLVSEAKTWIAKNDKTKKWEGRWGVLREALAGLILDYKRRQADLARRQQEEIERAAAEERKRKEAEARAAMRSGDVQGAQRAMEEARQVMTPVIMQATPVLDHSTTPEVWIIEVTDRMAVIKAVAAGIIPDQVIKELDLTFLKQEATRRGGLNWPGISAKKDLTLRVSRR
jgi:hypothetical protein